MYLFLPCQKLLVVNSRTSKFNLCLACPLIEMDAIFLIDANIGSSNQAFAATKKLLTKLVKSFEVGSHASRFAVVQYSDIQR